MSQNLLKASDRSPDACRDMCCEDKAKRVSTVSSPISNTQFQDTSVCLLTTTTTLAQFGPHAYTTTDVCSAHNVF